MGSDEELRMREALFAAVRVMDLEYDPNYLLVNNFGFFMGRIRTVCRTLFLGEQGAYEEAPEELGVIPEGLEIDELLSFFSHRYMVETLREYVETILFEEREKLLLRITEQKARISNRVWNRVDEICTENGFPEFGRRFITYKLYEAVALSLGKGVRENRTTLKLENLKDIEITLEGIGEKEEGLGSALANAFKTENQAMENAGLPKHLKIKVVCTFDGVDEQLTFNTNLTGAVSIVGENSHRFDDMQEVGGYASEIPALLGREHAHVETKKLVDGVLVQEEGDVPLLGTHKDQWYRKKRAVKKIEPGSGDEKRLVSEARVAIKTLPIADLRMRPKELYVKMFAYCGVALEEMQKHEQSSDLADARECDFGTHHSPEFLRWLATKLFEYDLKDLVTLLCSDKVLLNLGEHDQVAGPTNVTEVLPSLTDDADALKTFIREALPLIKKAPVSVRIKDERGFKAVMLEKCYDAAQVVMLGEHRTEELESAKKEGFSCLDQLLTHYIQRYSYDSILRACGAIQDEEREAGVALFLRDKVKWDNRDTWCQIYKYANGLLGREEEFRTKVCDFLAPQMLEFCRRNTIAIWDANKDRFRRFKISAEDLVGIDIEICEEQKSGGCFVKVKGAYRVSIKLRGGEANGKSEFRAFVPIGKILRDMEGVEEKHKPKALPAPPSHHSSTSKDTN